MIQDTTTAHLFSWASSTLNIGVDVVNYTLQLDTITGNFSNPRIAITTTNLSASITNTQLVAMVNAKYIGFNGKWRVIASAASVSPIFRSSDSANSIMITIGAFAGLKEQIAEATIQVYPNPSEGNVQIVSDKSIQQIMILDMTGRVVKTETPNQTKLIIDGSDWKKGVYLMKIITGEGQVVKRLLIQ